MAVRSLLNSCKSPATQSPSPNYKKRSLLSSFIAVTPGVNRSVVFNWFHEKRDSSAETVVEIAEARKSINPDAAAEFIRLYVGDFLE